VTVIGSLQSLKQLEALVKRASESLQKAGVENRSLRERLTRIEAENKRLKDDLRDARASLGRHERIRARLVRLSEKLEGIA
jgi:predicted nuclease with TOPRIM domain